MTFVKAAHLFDELFHVTSSALRLETRDSYGVPYENAPLSRYRAGLPVDTSYMDDWSAYIRDLRATGKVLRRVRILSVPLSDYQRFGLAQAAVNIAAGEEISYLDRATESAQGIPGYDYWIFDREAVGVLEFDGRDDLAGAHVVQDRAFVVQHLSWLETAWSLATPYAEFLGAHPVRPL